MACSNASMSQPLKADLKRLAPMYSNKIVHIVYKPTTIALVVKCENVSAFHRLQLSLNLQDSPGFLDFVPGP